MELGAKEILSWYKTVPALLRGRAEVEYYKASGITAYDPVYQVLTPAFVEWLKLNQTQAILDYYNRGKLALQMLPEDPPAQEEPLIEKIGEVVGPDHDAKKLTPEQLESLMTSPQKEHTKRVKSRGKRALIEKIRTTDLSSHQLNLLTLMVDAVKRRNFFKVVKSLIKVI